MSTENPCPQNRKGIVKQVNRPCFKASTNKLTIRFLYDWGTNVPLITPAEYNTNGGFSNCIEFCFRDYQHFDRPFNFHENQTVGVDNNLSDLLQKLNNTIQSYNYMYPLNAVLNITNHSVELQMERSCIEYWTGVDVTTERVCFSQIPAKGIDMSWNRFIVVPPKTIKVLPSLI